MHIPSSTLRPHGPLHLPKKTLEKLAFEDTALHAMLALQCTSNPSTNFWLENWLLKVNILMPTKKGTKSQYLIYRSRVMFGSHICNVNGNI
jgi:hypothetical protein